MGLKNGLYIMLYNQYEDGDEDFENEKYTKCIGAEHVGEVLCQFRQSFLKALLKRFDKRYSEEPRPYRMDFCYQKSEGDSIYPENLTEDKLLIFLLEGKTMSPDQREMLDSAVRVAEDMKQYIEEMDKTNLQPSVEPKAYNVKPQLVKKPKGKKVKPRRRLTKTEEEEAIKRYAEGETKNAIAKYFNISPSVFSRDSLATQMKNMRKLAQETRKKMYAELYGDDEKEEYMYGKR